MLETFPSDIFRTICQNLNLRDINNLTFVSKALRKSILEDNDFWAYQFKTHIHHFIEKVTRKGEPKSWYLVFEQTYIDQYKLRGPLKSTEKIPRPIVAALFSAAKNRDVIQFKKLYQEELDRLNKN